MGDRVEMVSKCIVGLFWGTNFPHGGKFVPQNSPTMHFDNHLDPVSRATFKWLISLREFCEPGKHGGGGMKELCGLSCRK